METNFIARKIEVKGKPEYIVEGYISTTDVDLFGDMVTEKCLSDMKKQLETRVIKMDEDHETYYENDYDMIPKLKIIDSKIDNKGLWVKAQLNQAHPEFKAIWESIKGGYLDAFSIQFVPKEQETIFIKGEEIRRLEKVDLINVGITGTPVNPEAKMEKFIVKALQKDKMIKMFSLETKGCGKKKKKMTQEMKSACDMLKAHGCKIIIPEDVEEVKPEDYQLTNIKSENKALCVTADGRKLPQNQTGGNAFSPEPSQSTGEEEESTKPDDKPKMAEETENVTPAQEEVKPEEQSTEVGEGDEPVETESVEEANPEEKTEEPAKEEAVEESKEEPKTEEEAPAAEETSEPSEKTEETAEVKALKEENASLKAKLLEAEKNLESPQLKALQESAPQTKQQAKTNVLDLIG